MTVPSSWSAREARVADAAYGAFATCREIDGITVMTVPEAPDSPMLNRIVGLGVERPATEDDLDAAIAAFSPGTTYYVAVTPNAEPQELPRWIEQRGLEAGWGWMAFRRGVDDPPESETSLRIAVVESAAEAEAFARIERLAFDLAPEVEQALKRAGGEWHRWLAWEGDEPAAAAGLYVADGVGYLGLGATLAEHRGKGGQSALVATRMVRGGRRHGQLAGRS